MSPALRLLRKDLGRDAGLLDQLPLATVRMVQTQQLNNCVPHKIYIGTITENEAIYDAWAFLSADLYRGQDSLPRMLFFAGPEKGPLKNYKRSQIDERCSWVDVFKIVSSDRRAVFIKVSRS